MDVPVAIGSVRSIGARTFDFSRQVAVMAIVNRTRDSFYDEGRTFALDRAVAAAERAVAEGADWIDIGAVPFSPRAREVTERDELERLLPVVDVLRASTDAVISVDTVRAEVARRVLAAGADAVNDTSGLHDPDMAGVIAAADAHLVITHSRAAPGVELVRPEYADVVSEVREFLAERVAYAVAEGVPTDHLIVDPGHDLNKNTRHSLELTRRLSELTTLGHPLLVSVSNKDFLQETLNRPADALTEGTVAAVVLCVVAGARVVRVHNVAAVRAGLGVVEAVLGWRPPAGPLRHNL
jgi:dihydropteroate synthase